MLFPTERIDRCSIACPLASRSSPIDQKDPRTVLTCQRQLAEDRTEFLTDLIDQLSSSFGDLLQIGDIRHVDMEELAENIDQLTEKIQNATQTEFAEFLIDDAQKCIELQQRGVDVQRNTFFPFCHSLERRSRLLHNTTYRSCRGFLG